MTIDEALNKIFSMHQFHIKLGLENIQKLLSHIGNPQEKLKAFHIAGSNGKGTTASFIASILQEAEYKVGLYTSPHLVKFNERVRINGIMIDDEYIASFINELNDYIDKEEPTFFEITTALAFKYFAENNIDYAVIETGLGGRLDATNTINPLACVFTSISKEHTNILGDNLKQIAGEKAGICKNGVPIFVGKMPEEAKEVFKSKSKEFNLGYYELESTFENYYNYIKIENEINLYKTPLRGNYQLLNAALAYITVKNTLPGVSKTCVFNGIKNVIKNSGIQGRYETILEYPKIIFDAAHNEEGIEQFINEFKKDEDLYSHKTVIFGGMKDKNLSKMLKQIAEVFDDIFVTTINYDRAAKFDDFKNISNKEGLNINYLENASDFIKNFRKNKNDECLVVLGSIYLLGELKKKLS